VLNSLNNSTYTTQKRPGFGNSLVTNLLGHHAFSKFFSTLDSNPVVEVLGVDFITMVAPRTIEDYKQNSDYGRETAIREVSSTLMMPFSSGLIGMGIMSANKLGGLFANSQSFNTFYEVWKNSEGNTKKYVKTVLENSKGEDGKIFKLFKDTMKPEEFDKYVDEITKIIEKGGKNTKKKINNVAERLIDSTKCSTNIKLSGFGEDYITNMRHLLRDTIDTAQKVFTKHSSTELERTVPMIRNLIKKKSIIGVSASVLFGLSTQAINAYITKHKTGSSKFPGYKDFGKKSFNPQNKKSEEKNKLSLNLKKGAAAAGLMLLTLATTGAFGKKGFFKSNGVGLKNLFNAYELRGPFAHMNIMKLIMGTTFIGRALAIRDETELITTPLRDLSTFINWLVIGPVISKGIIGKKNPSLINGKVEGKGFFTRTLSWLEDTSLKTTEEIQAAWPKSNKNKLALHNGARSTALLWSMFALGIGMPQFINHYIINKCCENGNKNSNTNLNKDSNNNSFADFLSKHKEIYKGYEGLIKNG